MLVFFFLKDPAPPDISPLPLHDPLPIASPPPTFGVTDEFYTFRTNPRDVAHILLRADPVSLETEGDLPLAWTKPYGAGRVYYNALGHFDAGWEAASFQAQLLGGLRWARSEEHTSELQSRQYLVCRLL